MHGSCCFDTRHSPFYPVAHFISKCVIILAFLLVNGFTLSGWKSAQFTNQGIRQGKRRNLGKTAQTLVHFEIVLKHSCLQQGTGSNIFSVQYFKINLRAQLKILMRKRNSNNKNTLKASGKYN